MFVNSERKIVISITKLAKTEIELKKKKFYQSVTRLIYTHYLSDQACTMYRTITPSSFRVFKKLMFSSVFNP